MTPATLRLDKLLWFLRLAKTRSIAQERIAQGHIRVNGARRDRRAAPVAAGDILTLPLGARTAVVEVLILPTRRGPASEAQACYRVLDAPARVAIAGDTDQPLVDPVGNPLP